MPVYSSCTHLQAPNGNGAPQNRKPIAITMQWLGGTTIYRDLTLLSAMTTSPYKSFWMVKNASNKENRWSLELAIHSIKLESISGAHKKVADCLSWLVDAKDTPAILTALINMLVTSTPDGSATHAHSKTCNTANTTSADLMPTSCYDRVNMPPPLTEDQKDTLRLMQRTDLFCKCISKRLLSGKAPSHKVNTFTHIKVLIYKHVMDLNWRFLVLVIPKSWHLQ